MGLILFWVSYFVGYSRRSCCFWALSFLKSSAEMIISKRYVSSCNGWFSWQSWFKWHGAKTTKATDLISLRTHTIHTPLSTFCTLKLWKAALQMEATVTGKTSQGLGAWYSLSVLTRETIYKLAQEHNTEERPPYIFKMTWRSSHKGLSVQPMETLFIHLTTYSSVWKSQQRWFLVYQKCKQFHEVPNFRDLIPFPGLRGYPMVIWVFRTQSFLIQTLLCQDWERRCGGRQRGKQQWLPWCAPY